MNILMYFSLSFTMALASSEIRFDPSFEESCFKEVRKLKCGDPDKDEETFMTCVDKKLGRLSKGCQEMHKSIRAESRKHQHKH